MRLLQWAFKLYDKDGGGAIDISEMVEAVGTLHAMSAVDLKGPEDLAGKAGAIFRHFDVDGDGSISEEEFVAGEGRTREFILNS